jgi:hypothetical protein
MLKSRVKPGAGYAFRQQRAPGTPFKRVRIIQHTRGTKWRAEWINPSPGLIEYVDSGQHIVPCKGHKEFLMEEAGDEFPNVDHATVAIRMPSFYT